MNLPATPFAKFLIFLICLMLLDLSGLAQDAPMEVSNPRPAQGDLLIPLPGGFSLVFRPVAVGEDKGAFSSNAYKIGDRAEGGFQEFPTDVSVAGSVLIEEAGKKVWAYYLGKYEISEAQYYSVMGNGTSEQRVSAFPVRNLSWFEVVAFTDRLNQWLFANAKDKLPTQRGRPCFVRLPTEAEWEFAARGGLKVSANEFDRKHPYSAPLQKHEWYSGPESSHGQVKRIGRLAPNILGLHDMLGNVSEMTNSAYAVEYYQGRVGGITVRGGSVLTLNNDIRSSYRNELPYYDREFKPARQDTLGVRLALGSQIFTDPMAINDMEKEWESYRKVRVVPTLSNPATPNAASATVSRVAELQQNLEKLQQVASSLPPDAANLIGLAVGAAQNIQADIAQSHKRLALASSRELYLAGGIWARCLLMLPMVESNLKSKSNTKEESARFSEQKLKLDQDLKVSQERYGSALRNLGTLNSDMVAAALAELAEVSVKDLQSNEGKIFNLARAHYRAFENTQRVDISLYEKDFRMVYQKTNP